MLKAISPDCKAVRNQQIDFQLTTRTMRQFPLLDVFQVGVGRAVLTVLLFLLHGEDNACVRHVICTSPHGWGAYRLILQILRDIVVPFVFASTLFYSFNESTVTYFRYSMLSPFQSYDTIL